MSLRIALTHVYAWPDVRRGGERYLHELARALADAGHRVAILSTALTAHRDRVLGVDIRYFRRRYRAKIERWFPDQGDEVVFAAEALARLGLRRLDVWHALGTADAAAASTMGRFRRTRSVYTDLGIPELPWRDQRSDWKLHRYVVRHVDRYVCLSETAGRGLRTHFGREPIVLGGGVDIQGFQPAAQRSSDPTLLFTSDAGERRKNLPLLLEAVALLRRRYAKLQLWLAGPGDPAPFLEAAPPDARDAAVPCGVGSLEELVRRYGTAWVTVLPSANEAFGLVILESLACGTPVVTLAGGAPAELVRPGIGFASAPAAPALAEALQRAIDLAGDPATAIACRAAAEPYDWRTGIVPRMEAIYCDE